MNDRQRARDAMGQVSPWHLFLILLFDRNGKRGVEVKTGYVSLTADVAYQIKRDAWLGAKENWSIHWRAEGRMRAPLRAALKAADIEFTETQPDTLIKDL